MNGMGDFPGQGSRRFLVVRGEHSWTPLLPGFVPDQHGSAEDAARRRRNGAAPWAAPRVAGPAERPAAAGTRSQAGRDDQVQRVVAHEARPLGGSAPLAHRRLQPARQRVPVQLDGAVRLAPPHLHREALHRHGQLQRLHPFGRHPCRILARKVVELGAVLALDRLGPLLFAPLPRIFHGQREGAAHGVGALGGWRSR